MSSCPLIIRLPPDPPLSSPDITHHSSPPQTPPQKIRLLLCLVMYHCAADLIATASSGPWRISWHILNYESAYNCPFRDFIWCSSIFKLKKPNAWIEVSVTTKDHKIEIVYQVVYFTSSLVAPLTHAVLLSSQQSHRYCCHGAAGDENHVSAERFEENILN